MLLLPAASLVFLRVKFLRVKQPSWLISVACGIPATVLVAAYLLWQSLHDWRRRYYVYKDGVDGVDVVADREMHLLLFALGSTLKTGNIHRAYAAT